MRPRLPCALLLAALAGCGGWRPPAAEPAPPGPLPEGAAPLRYRLELEIVPERESFTGEVAIELELARPLRVLWLHAQELRPRAVELALPDGQRMAGRLEARGDSGVAALLLPRPAGPGRATLHIAWEAPLSRQLRGLYRVDVGEDAYAFSQFEPVAARLAFPGFDEPRFKTPFEIALRVRSEHAAISNAPALAEEDLGHGKRRVRFAPTPPLPTYLVAFAVGPLDLVEAPPLPPRGRRERALPLRGVAPRGRGGELAHALTHAPPLLEALEDWFGIPFPFAKLALLAVPDFAAGAMENAGAITFRDGLLLLDPERAPEEQIRSLRYVMAHELAHMWFGDLVTPRWWDDLWLNEAFATWLGRRAVEGVAPEQRSELAQRAEVQRAMDVDSLVAARRIRQPIASPHDIHNAFDPITYGKGSAVLGMFERWLGREAFRRGIQGYLERFAGGSATAADLLEALSRAAGRDVAAPFHSFLEQPGVPLVEAELRCLGGEARLALRQSRSLPQGSQGSRAALWQVPVCARLGGPGGDRELCHLLTAAEESIAAGSPCPAWLLPNADAAGYYRFAPVGAPGGWLAALGFGALEPRERLAAWDSLRAAFRSGALPLAELLAALPAVAADPERLVATAPRGILAFLREELADAASRPGVEALARGLYGSRGPGLGWDARPGEGGEARLLRADVLEILARTGQDPAVRREAAQRGAALARRLEAGDFGDPSLAPELRPLALELAVQEGDPALFDALAARLGTSRDAIERRAILRALGAALDPERAARARALALDPRLRVNEVLLPLASQMSRPSLRAGAWSWIEARFDALVARLGPEGAAGLPALAGELCDEASAADVERFLRPRVAALAGGPRDLEAALETIRLCAALVRARGGELRALLGPDQRAAGTGRTKVPEPGTPEGPKRLGRHQQVAGPGSPAS